VGLLAGGLGRLGVPGLYGSWETLAVGGAAVGLLALILYFHPWYSLAVLINGAILASLLGQARSVVVGG
jgi:hypothetical protein